ncbi:MAG: PorV/PorQ family protein [Candidatus Marinimicrobia bacterium]|nr:PorV/PorQ family protein [Candidatus Neomarinimicrobiota bacterium]
MRNYNSYAQVKSNKSLNLKRMVSTILLLVLFALPGLSQDARQDSLNAVLPGDDFSKVATSVGQFLKLEYGAAGAAVGGAYTALAHGAVAMAWNPAGIAFSNGPDLYVSSTKLYAGISSNYLGLTLPMGGGNTIGIIAQYMNSGDMEVTTLDYPNGTGEQFQVSGMALGLAFTRMLTDRLSVGITGKMIRETIYRETASTFAFDIGSNFDLGIYGMVLGMSIQNFGVGTRFDGPDLNQIVDINDDLQGNPELTSRLLTEEWPLPIVFRAGIRADVIGGKSPWYPTPAHRLSILVDANDPFDAVLRGALGFEYGWNNIFFLRGGYKIKYEWPIQYDIYTVEYNNEYDLGEEYFDQNGNGVFDDNEAFTDGLRVKSDEVNIGSWDSYYGSDKYSLRRFSMGMGVKYNLYGTKLLFDYSYSNYGIIGMVQQVSLGFGF